MLLDGDREMRVCAEGLSAYDTLKRKWIIGKELELSDLIWRAEPQVEVMSTLV